MKVKALKSSLALHCRSNRRTRQTNQSRDSHNWLHRYLYSEDISSVLYYERSL